MKSMATTAPMLSARRRRSGAQVFNSTARAHLMKAPSGEQTDRTCAEDRDRIAAFHLQAPCGVPAAVENVKSGAREVVFRAPMTQACREASDN